MKEDTNFEKGFWGAEAVATKPIRKPKYLDWKKAEELVKQHPDSVIYAGLQEDWYNTNSVIYVKGTYYDGGGVYDRSFWATPILDIDGTEYECFTYEEQSEAIGVPADWGHGEKLLSHWDYPSYPSPEEFNDEED